MSATAHRRKDSYSRITASIVTQVERGRSWVRAWNPEHPAGAITRSVRYAGHLSRDERALVLGAAMAHCIAAPMLEGLWNARRPEIILEIKADLTTRATLSSRKLP